MKYNYGNYLLRVIMSLYIMNASVIWSFSSSRLFLFLIFLFLLVIMMVMVATILKLNREGKEGREGREGFISEHKNKKWSNDLISRFITYQTIINQNKIQYNLDILQQQATPEEAEHLLHTGIWPWSDTLKDSYINHVSVIPIIKIDPIHALNYAMKIYNERAMLELISWNEKEGQFLLYGGDLGVSYNVPGNNHNTITCAGNTGVQKKIYTDINGNITTIIENVKNENIPKEMSGFAFVKGPCNPCVALNDDADFSCPFTLNEQGDKTPSKSWSLLWGL